MIYNNGTTDFDQISTKILKKKSGRSRIIQTIILIVVTPAIHPKLHPRTQLKLMQHTKNVHKRQTERRIVFRYRAIIFS